MNFPKCGVGGKNMSSRFVIVYSLIVSVIFGIANCVVPRHDVINAARCRVRCLGNIHSQEDHSLPSILQRVNQATSLMTCLQMTECTACMKPCRQQFIGLELCQRSCEDATPSCLASCQFLEEISQQRSGHCPSHDVVVPAASSSSSACLADCDTDLDCDRDLKCCADGCGRSCRPPRNKYQGMPRIPPTPTVRERMKGGSLEVRWDSVHSNESGLILYIVDSKWNVGTHPSEAHATPWQQIAQTTVQSTIMRDVTPGHWYQFRVEAVNFHGSRGPSPPTQPLRLSREPSPPGPPANLTEGDTLITDRRVAVTIKWLPPTKSDLPITRYRVFWSKRVEALEDAEEEEEMRHVLPGDQLVFQIPSLEQDTTYFVQVQAVCHYGDSRLKSDKASIYITTYPLPRAQLPDDRRDDDEVVVVPLPTPAPVSNIEVAQPYFVQGQMRANVSWNLPPVSQGEPHTAKVLLFWSPEVCIADDGADDNLSRVMTGTTQDTRYTIYRLQFDCIYVVRVQSMSSEGVTGAAEELSFPTPSCNEVALVTDERPECPDSVRAPDQPPHFQHKFIISSSSHINASLSWDEPRYDGELTGYRVVWGRVQDSSFDPVLDPTTALTSVLPRDVRVFTVGGLEEASTYVVHVQALTDDLPGHVAAIHFTTPMLSLGRRNPPYKHVTSSSASVTPPTPITTTQRPTPQPMGRNPDVTEQPQNSAPSARCQAPLLQWQLVLIVLLYVCHGL